jgi:hypothetical protein
MFEMRAMATLTRGVERRGGMGERKCSIRLWGSFTYTSRAIRRNLYMYRG